MTMQGTILRERRKPSPPPPPRVEATGSWDRAAAKFANQAEKLSHLHPGTGEDDGIAVEARFVTPRDPVIVTSDGNRLPPVPLQEAHKLNVLRKELEHHEPTVAPASSGGPSHDGAEASVESDIKRVAAIAAEKTRRAPRRSSGGSLREAVPPTHTNPLFPPLPLYGPPSRLRNVQCLIFRVSSFFLSLAFLSVIVLGALFTSIPPSLQRIWQFLTLQNPDANRPFHAEEEERKRRRKEEEQQWMHRQATGNHDTSPDSDGFTPTEGGPDPIVCDPAYYARRVGLDMEMFQVQTEDGFIIDLWHVYDPKEYEPLPEEQRAAGDPAAFQPPKRRRPGHQSGNSSSNQKPKFPVLLMHGLLQSSGAYCVNDDASLAFYLCKSGFDVWLGNNRCGFSPRHALLDYADPRMWCWNIRQMGVFDLPALASRVLYETGFSRCGLVCHSQGTTQALVALAKQQRPDLGERLTVFCALAPAAYAGPLIGKMYFKFMRVITPAMFRLMFGIHAFIPFMMTMHALLAPRVYGWLGYKVFSFLFNWTDTRWDRGLRDRMFQFAPVYVSAESMRWWLGRECFARHKCILATKEEWRAEEREDDREHHHQDDGGEDGDGILAAADRDMEEGGTGGGGQDEEGPIERKRRPRGSTAWYNHQAPPFALWVCGNDALVDGGRLLRRLGVGRDGRGRGRGGREPHVRVVHAKVIPEYEHLDVIWAMDAPEQVFCEVREVLWKTCDVRDECRVPVGCEDVQPWVRDGDGDDEGDGEGEGGEGDEMQSQSSSSEELSS